MANKAKTPAERRKALVRKQVPEGIDVIGEYLKSSDREEVVNQAKIALGEKANDMHFCFHKSNADGMMLRTQGYEPVLVGVSDGKTKQLGHKRDLLWMCSERQSFVQREGPAQMSREALGSTMDGTDEKYTGLENLEEK